MDKELTAKLIDALYGAGSYENPARLLLNPEEADEKKWRRRDPDKVDDRDLLKTFSESETAEVIRYAAEFRGGWRISNAKAKIREKAVAQERKTRDEQVTKSIIGFYDAALKVPKGPARENLLNALRESYDRTTIIEVFRKASRQVPEELVTK